MEHVIFIGDITKDFFRRLYIYIYIYGNIKMSQANGIIPLQLNISANPDLRVRMHHRIQHAQRQM
jgi:hypothetical protein